MEHSHLFLKNNKNPWTVRNLFDVGAKISNNIKINEKNFQNSPNFLSLFNVTQSCDILHPCLKFSTFIRVMLFFQTEVDIIEDIDEYQTWPGWFILVLRCAIIVWFLMELKTTMLYEHNTAKLQFFLHFGASALVWFIYLPIVAVIALQIPALWRFKLLLGMFPNFYFFFSSLMKMRPTMSDGFY